MNTQFLELFQDNGDNWVQCLNSTLNFQALAITTNSSYNKNKVELFQKPRK